MIKSETPLYIITTAYKAKKYLKHYILSLYNLSTEVENSFVYIGIDGCKETLDEVIRIQKNFPESNKNFKYYYSEKNVGTYVLKNSLLKIIQQHNSIVHFFDIDDIILPGYIEANFKKCLHLKSKFGDNFLLRAMHLPIDNGIIEYAFQDKNMQNFNDELIELLIAKDQFFEALICLVIMCINHKKVRNVQTLLMKKYQSLKLNMIRKLKAHEMKEQLEMLLKILSNKYESVDFYKYISDIIKLYYIYEFDLNSLYHKKYLPVQSAGVFFCTYNCIKNLGFFNKYRVDQDTDIIKRAQARGINLIVEETLPFFIRRITTTSLTRRSDTGLFSPYRLRIRSINDKLIAKNILTAKGISQPLTEIKI